MLLCRSYTRRPSHYSCSASNLTFASRLRLSKEGLVNLTGAKGVLLDSSALCASALSIIVGSHAFMTSTRRGEGRSGSCGCLWMGEEGSAPCGRSHRKLLLTDILSSSHAK